MAIPNVTAYKQYKEIDVHIEKYIVHFSRLSRLDSKKKKTECVYICISTALYCSRSQFAGMIGPQGYAVHCIPRNNKILAYIILVVVTSARRENVS